MAFTKVSDVLKREDDSDFIDMLGALRSRPSGDNAEKVQERIRAMSAIDKERAESILMRMSS